MMNKKKRIHDLRSLRREKKALELEIIERETAIMASAYSIKNTLWSFGEKPETEAGNDVVIEAAAISVVDTLLQKIGMKKTAYRSIAKTVVSAAVLRYGGSLKDYIRKVVGK